MLANNERCTPDDIADGVIELIEDDRLGGGVWLAIGRVNGKVEHQWGTHDTV